MRGGSSIIGAKTGGNVLGAVNVKLGGGYWLRLPVFGWYTSQGNCVEGNDVVPDLAVELDPGELNQGTDRQLAAAMKVLTCANQDAPAPPLASSATGH
jgi:C-terminal processing protease CtpA/Prc